MEKQNKGLQKPEAKINHGNMKKPPSLHNLHPISKQPQDSPNISERSNKKVSNGGSGSPGRGNRGDNKDIPKAAPTAQNGILNNLSKLNNWMTADLLTIVVTFVVGWFIGSLLPAIWSVHSELSAHCQEAYKLKAAHEEVSLLKE